jgi:putative transposase
MRQQEFHFPKRGGKRAGAGRKRTKSGWPCVPHRARPRHNHAHPVHVTLRLREGLPPLRHAGIFAEVRTAIARANRSPAVGDAFRVVEFSIQSNHAHFIIEAHDKRVLSSGLRGLAIRLARAINRALEIRGPVWGDRYHARDLKTPRAVRNAIVYVLMNAKKHGTRLQSGIDAFSSAPWFAGFAERLVPSSETPPVRAPRTWLASIGWRRRGLVHVDERPRVPD